MPASGNSEILDALTKAAKEGRLSAAFILGRLYDEGWGVEQNSRTAFRWYKRAAQGGLTEAYYFVGSAYAFGDGVQRNNKRAFEWFRKAAAAGDLTGAYMEALYLFEGVGVQRDERLGRKLLLTAARRGSRGAMDYLAAHYLRLGRLRTARRWAERAIHAGDEVALLRLQEIERRSRGPNSKTGS